jgi:hypothetical protein
MKKILATLVALLLIPALIADPVVASAFQFKSVISAPHRKVISVFEQQALSPVQMTNLHPVRYIQNGLVFLSVLTSVFVIACGGSPTGPSTTPPPPPAQTFPVTIQAVESLSGSPVSGLNVSLNSVAAAGSTDGGGMITIPNQNAGTYPVSINGGTSILQRDANLSIQQGTEPKQVSVIVNAPPFYDQFFEDFLRNNFEGNGTKQPLRPWTMDPSYYIKTTNEDGIAVVPSVIDSLIKIIRNSVPALTSGKRQVAAIETGPDDRPAQVGWVRILLMRVLPNPSAGGQSTVGGDTGTIWLQYDPDHPFPSQITKCVSFASGALEHEIVHSIGGWHTSAADEAVFGNPFGNTLNLCDGTHRTPAAIYHMTLSYTRSPGNVYPDKDAASVILGQQYMLGRAVQSLEGPVVSDSPSILYSGRHLISELFPSLARILHLQMPRAVATHARSTAA